MLFESINPERIVHLFPTCNLATRDVQVIGKYKSKFKSKMTLICLWF